MIPTLRPHHGMCIANFEGKGYSPSFTERMTMVCRQYPVSDPQIRLVLQCDDSICIACPFNHNGTCESEEKVLRFDRAVLDMLNLKENAELSYNNFFDRAEKEIVKGGKRPKICKDCQWNSICRKNDPVL